MKQKNLGRKKGTNTILSSSMKTILKKKGKNDRSQRIHLHTDSRRPTTLRPSPFQEDAQVVEEGPPDHLGRLAKDHAAVNSAARFLDNQHLQQISLVNIRDSGKYYTWLRQRTATHHFALMTDVGIRPVNTNAQILDLFTGKGRKWLPTIRNRNFDDHMTGTDTFYFQGNGQASAPETLVMIDVDCHGMSGDASRIYSSLANTQRPT